MLLEFIGLNPCAVFMLFHTRIEKQLSGKQASQIVYVPEAATTVLRTPDDGRDGRLKHVE